MDTEGGVPADRFAALTAPPSLTSLKVENQSRPLAVGAGQHMFPAGKQLQLQHVTLSVAANNNRFREDDWFLKAEDLSKLICSCRKLQYLDICGAPHPSTDMAVLQLLPRSCATLYISGMMITDASAPALAQLTQLRQLCCCRCPNLTDVGLEQLTALTELTFLAFEGCSNLSEGFTSSLGDSGRTLVEDDDDDNDDDAVCQWIGMAL